MSYTSIADNLLKKRCDFLESQLSWPSTVPDTPREGYEFRHFRANGLSLVGADKATRGSERDLESFPRDYNNHLAQAASHFLELFAVGKDQYVSVNYSGSSWRDQGMDPNQWRANSGLGFYMRYYWARALVAAYGKHPGVERSNNYRHVTQLYKTYAVSPANPNTLSPSRQELLDLGTANKLYYALDRRFISEEMGSVWSARYDGFPDGNFPNTDFHIPYGVTDRGSVNVNNVYDTQRCVYANPTVLLFTIEVPIGFEQWYANTANDNEQANVRMYLRWHSVPHYMGYGIEASGTYFGRYSSERRPYNYHNWIGADSNNLGFYNTVIFVSDSSNVGNRDVLLHIPGDEWTDPSPVPIL